MPIQPSVDAAPRQSPPDAQVLGSPSIQSQIDSLQAAHAQGIASLQSQIDMLTQALGVLGQRFTDSQISAVHAGMSAGSAHPVHESPSNGQMSRPTQIPNQEHMGKTSSTARTVLLVPARSLVVRVMRKKSPQMT